MNNLKIGDLVHDNTRVFPDEEVYIIDFIYPDGNCQIRRTKPIDDFGILCNTINRDSLTKVI